MSVSTKSFTQLVSDMQSAIQGAAVALIDMSAGSVLLALTQAFASVVLWLQAQILQVMLFSRASGSTGADLDSWMADFGIVARLPAVPAVDVAVFGRYSSTDAAIVYPGAVLTESSTGVITVTGTAAAQSQDGTALFGVYTDTTNSFWNTTLLAYYIPAATASAALPVVCMTAGTVGNILATTLNTLAAALPGIDTVNNTTDYRNGADIEGDDALRSRFRLALAALSQATIDAITSAVLAVQDNLTCIVVENKNYADDVTLYGVFYVIVDDGTGSPGSTLLAAILSAVNRVRPITVVCQGVFAPTIVTASISMTVVLAPGYDPTTTAAIVDTALAAFMDGLRMGDGVAYTRLAQVAYDASPGVLNVTSVLLAGGTSDIPAAAKTHVNAGTITVTPA